MNNPQLKNQLKDQANAKTENKGSKPKFAKKGGGKAHGSYERIELQEEACMVSLQFSRDWFDAEEWGAKLTHWTEMRTHHPHSHYITEFGHQEVQVNNKDDDHNKGRKLGFTGGVQVWDLFQKLGGEQGYKLISVGLSKGFLVAHFMHPDAVEALELQPIPMPSASGDSFLAQLCRGEVFELSVSGFENIYRDGDGWRTSYVNLNLKGTRKSWGKPKELELVIPSDD